MVTGVLAQFLDGAIRVYWDIAREGEPSAVIRDVVAAANLEAGRAVRTVIGPLHFDKYNNVGLAQALKAIPVDVRQGTPSDMGRQYLRPLFNRESRAGMMFMVSDQAKWTLNALAGGYSRAMLKQGMLADYAEEGVYRVLMEGLESFAGVLRTGSPDEEDNGRNYAFTGDGRRYTSALGSR